MAATVHRWRATPGNGDWAGATSWDTLGTPGDGGAGLDTALFDGVSQASCDTNLDRVTALDSELYRIVTYVGYTGNIGSPTNYLYHGLVSSSNAYSRFIHRGTGQVWFKGSPTAFQDVYVDTTRNPSTTAVFLEGEIRKLLVKQGAVYIGTGCTVSKLYILGPLATCEIATGATSPPTYIEVLGGLLINNRDDLAGTKTMYIGPGGIVRQRGILATARTIINHGVLQLEPSSNPSTNPILYNDGIIDLSLANYSYSWGDIVLGPNSVIVGGALEVGGITTLGTYLDAREEYP